MTELGNARSLIVTLNMPLLRDVNEERQQRVDHIIATYREEQRRSEIPRGEAVKVVVARLEEPSHTRTERRRGGPRRRA